MWWNQRRMIGRVALPRRNPGAAYRQELARGRQGADGKWHFSSPPGVAQVRQVCGLELEDGERCRRHPLHDGSCRSRSEPEPESGPQAPET